MSVRSATVGGDFGTPDVDIVSRVAWRILPVCFLAYFIAFLDRINVGYAALTMNADLGLKPAAFGFGASLFYIGFIVLELPSNVLIKRFGPRLWLGRIMISWGLVSGAFAFVQGETSFYAMRFLLGVAEAGFVPCYMLYLRAWFPQSYQGRALGLSLIAVPFASALGGPLAVGIFGLDGLAGLRGWQWMFIVEAIPAIVLGLVFIFVLKDGPKDAAWLSQAEAGRLAARLEADEATRAQAKMGQLGFWSVALDRRVLLLGAIYFCVLMPNATLTLWMPQIIKSLGFSTVQTGFLASSPFVLGVIGMILFSRLADRTHRRREIAAAGLAISAIGVTAAAYLPAPWMKLIAFAVAAFGTFGANPVFWSLPANLLGNRAAGGGFAVIGSLGVLASAFGPTMLGYVKETTGNFDNGLFLIAAITALGAAIMAFVPRPAAPAP